MGDGSIDKVINRVLFCTSPLQVINARSAMDYMESNLKCNDYVVMVHPLLLENTKKQINHIAKILDYSNVIDLTFLEKKYNQEKERLSLIKKIFMIKRLLNDRIEKHIELQGEISDILQKKIGKIDIVFFRMAYKYIDSLFINSQKQAKWYGIEDGLGDYIPHNWAFTTLNAHEIKHKIKSKFYSYLWYILSVLCIRKFTESKIVFLRPLCKYNKRFSNIKMSDSICVENFYRNNILKLAGNNNKVLSPKVIIIGSLISDPRFKLDLYREVEIYNSVVGIILERQKIRQEQIWYKHHPRLDHTNWEYKKSNMSCSFYDYENTGLVDIELMNENVISVYSVGSTALLYAKMILGIPSYLIDISKENCHPSAYKKYKYVAETYNIPIIKI